MVYFTKIMARTIMVHPQYLGPALRPYVKEQLIAEVEGMSVDNAGFIIAVLNVEESGITRGLIDHLTGFVRYSIRYTALMFRPFKNEVLDATVKAVSDVSLSRWGVAVDAAATATTDLHILPADWRSYFWASKVASDPSSLLALHSAAAVAAEL